MGMRPLIAPPGGGAAWTARIRAQTRASSSGLPEDFATPQLSIRPLAPTLKVNTALPLPEIPASAAAIAP